MVLILAIQAFVLGAVTCKRRSGRAFLAVQGAAFSRSTTKKADFWMQLLFQAEFSSAFSAKYLATEGAAEV